MGKILSINEAQAKPKPQTQTLPTESQITEDLGTMLAQMMGFFRANGVPGFYIVSLGIILSQLKFDSDPKERQTATDIQLLTQKQAAKQLEEMKLWLLRQSIPSGPIN